MKKRVLSMMLVVVLLVGIVTAGSVAYGPAYSDEENQVRQVSDYFYIQIYDTNDQVVSRYKITLTGTVSARNREITGVSFVCEFGDLCETIQQIDGDMVGIIITHPTEGYLIRVFALDENGVFSEC